jgi:hypothetical protein
MRKFDAKVAFRRYTTKLTMDPRNTSAIAAFPACKAVAPTDSSDAVDSGR